MAAVEQDTRFERLPKWAQIEIGRLRNDLAGAKAKLAVGPEDSDTFADPYSRFVEGGAATPLGRGPTIHFGALDGPLRRDGFDVRLLEDGGLRVMGESQMVVEPQASNVVVLRPAVS